MKIEQSLLKQSSNMLNKYASQSVSEYVDPSRWVGLFQPGLIHWKPYRDRPRPHLKLCFYMPCRPRERLCSDRRGGGGILHELLSASLHNSNMLHTHKLFYTIPQVTHSVPVAFQGDRGTQVGTHLLGSPISVNGAVPCAF